MVVLQGKLNAISAPPPLVTDGAFGPLTKGAVVTYQTSRGLIADAIVGPHTWEALLSDVPGPSTTTEQPTGAHLLPGSPTSAATKDRYRFEIKAWIPVPEVVDPEQPIREAAEILSAATRLAQLSSFLTRYHGDGHVGYDGAFRVSTAIEFDWDGHVMSNSQVAAMPNYGESRRRFVVSTREGSPPRTVTTRGEDKRTATSAVRGGQDNPNQVSLGMSSANPLTIAPSPDIDADYTLFMSSDEIFGHTEATVRWSTDLMPNHGFRVEKNGTVVAERVVNDITTRGIDPLSAAAAVAIGLWLTSKAAGGAHSFQP